MVNNRKLKIIAGLPYIMPALVSTAYSPPSWLINGHLETIYPALLRTVKNVPVVQRKRIGTPDDDFLDLDMMAQGSKKLVVMQHGLEGSSQRAYMQGMGKIFFENGFDSCLWNYRGCSGVLNDQPIFYHSGATHDLDTVIQSLENRYEEIYLVGFSLGGNLTLKFLGEKPHSLKIKKSVVFSVPMDLSSTSKNLMKPKCLIYERRFLRNLRTKVIRKSKNLPGHFDVKALDRVKTLWDFDEVVTAPLHGFASASDYYQKCSSRSFLHGITIPTLIVNALNDPLLTPECLDRSMVETHPNVTLELTTSGGHVGFADFKSPYYWSEKRALDFILGNS